MWYIAISTMFQGGRDRGNQAAAIGLVAFILYFVTNLLVMYGSRIREYYADRGSIGFGSKPTYLASALYKLVYGSAVSSKDELKRIEGMKAFFANDPSKAHAEFAELSKLDMNRSGSIDESELVFLKDKKVKVSGTDKLLEMLSTHPNMLKRISALSKLN